MPRKRSPKAERAKGALPATRTMASVGGMASFSGYLTPKTDANDSHYDEFDFDVVGKVSALRGEVALHGVNARSALSLTTQPNGMLSTAG